MNWVLTVTTHNNQTLAFLVTGVETEESAWNALNEAYDIAPAKIACRSARQTEGKVFRIDPNALLHDGRQEEDRP